MLYVVSMEVQKIAIVKSWRMTFRPVVLFGHPLHCLHCLGLQVLQLFHSAVHDKQSSVLKSRQTLILRSIFEVAISAQGAGVNMYVYV